MPSQYLYNPIKHELTIIDSDLRQEYFLKPEGFIPDKKHLVLDFNQTPQGPPIPIQFKSNGEIEIQDPDLIQKMSGLAQYWVTIKGPRMSETDLFGLQVLGVTAIRDDDPLLNTMCPCVGP